ncbi:MAG: hypothetical protein M3247_07315 [Thermoproteota archaeon]|nr:hypothetical protein [Thermoproteota archaeon]
MYNIENYQNKASDGSSFLTFARLSRDCDDDKMALRISESGRETGSYARPLPRKDLTLQVNLLLDRQHFEEATDLISHKI